MEQATQRPAAPENEELHGLVWEADPSDPGRIVTPASFATLGALPQILSEFLYASLGDGDDEGES